MDKVLSLICATETGSMFSHDVCDSLSSLKNYRQSMLKLYDEAVVCLRTAKLDDAANFERKAPKVFEQVTQVIERISSPSFTLDVINIGKDALISTSDVQTVVRELAGKTIIGLEYDESLSLYARCIHSQITDINVSILKKFLSTLKDMLGYVNPYTSLPIVPLESEDVPANRTREEAKAIFRERYQLPRLNLEKLASEEEYFVLVKKWFNGDSDVNADLTPLFMKKLDELYWYLTDNEAIFENDRNYALLLFRVSGVGREIARWKDKYIHWRNGVKGDYISFIKYLVPAADYSRAKDFFRIGDREEPPYGNSTSSNFSKNDFSNGLHAILGDKPTKSEL